MNTRKAFLIVAATAGCGIGYVLAADQPLPWEREIPLREAAKSVALADKLNPTSPLPSGEYFGGAAMSINNLKVDYPASTVEGELRIAVMEPTLMLKPYMNNDGLSILFPVSLGRMQQTYSECFSNKNHTL